MIVGVIAGYAFGKLMVWLLNHIKLDIEGLYPVLVLALIFFAFSLSDAIGGNGFLAVYIAGIIMGNSSFMHKKSLIRFYDGQAWLMQIIMFLTLGLLVFPSHLPPIMGKGLLISLFLIFVARPIAVFISLSFAKDLNVRKKLFISWVGLRGAAPIVFATYPLIAGIHYADTIFHLVFFISAMSVLLQGTTLPIMAKWLHVIVPEKIKRKFPLDLELKDNSKSELVELDVPQDSRAVGKQVLDLHLPTNAMIVLIHRDGKYISASGDTIIEPQDHLLVMADNKDAVDKIYNSFGIPLTH
jgi:cell volume regulation protein A